MAITVNDVRLFASERMTDNADGGGRMSASVIVDGVDNNVFPDVSEIDTLLGAVHIRKLFGSVLSDDTDTYANAFVLLTEPPATTGASATMFRTGGYGTEMSAVLNALLVPAWSLAQTTGNPTSRAGTVTGGVNLNVPEGIPADWQTAILVIATAAGDYIRSAVSFSAGNNYVLDAAVPGADPLTVQVRVAVRGSGPRHYGAGTSAASIASGAVSVTLDATMSKVVPHNDADVYPTTGLPAWRLDPSVFFATQGYAPLFYPNDPVLVHHTATTAPVAVSNGQVLNVGRTGLARARLIDGNDFEVARFDRGLPAPSGAATADLDAGTVTIVSVTGIQQPVRVEHRIEELSLVASSLHGAHELLLSRPLGRAFPAGTRVSSALMLGDLRARATRGFAQTAWTTVWSDTVIGGSPTADYNTNLHPFEVTNRGAITQRWAVIFTNTTSFRLIGEDVGEVGTGNTGTDFSPTNPATGVPYLTVRASGWGLGWSNGNVYRFDTFGAVAPFYELRCLRPGAAGGNDQVETEFRGYINT